MKLYLVALKMISHWNINIISTQFLKPIEEYVPFVKHFYEKQISFIVILSIINIYL